MDNEVAIHPEAVSAYLRAHPQFFEQHLDLLTSIHLPSPHGGGTVSLTERQQLLQRDRIRALESKLAELMGYGKENDDINERIHLLSLCLIASTDFEVLSEILITSLKDDFNVPQATLKLWAQPKEAAYLTHEAFAALDATVLNWANSSKQPYCGDNPEFNWKSLFAQTAELNSVALITLRGEKTFGLLAMASPDAKRFNSEMGTVFLRRIGELVSAAMIRHIKE